MTGGTVVVLGKAGINFAAGMTGGLAWVYDDSGFVDQGRFHPDFVELEGFAGLDEEARGSLRGLLERHVEASRSVLAGRMLAEWETFGPRFVRLTPKPQV